jgi:hypothetical protein
VDGLRQELLQRPYNVSSVYAECPRNKYSYINLDGESYGSKQLREFIETWVQKCFSNELEPFEGVPAAGGLEVWLRKQRMLRKTFQENGGQSGGYVQLVAFPHYRLPPFSNKTHIHHGVPAPVW